MADQSGLLEQPVLPANDGFGATGDIISDDPGEYVASNGDDCSGPCIAGLTVTASSNPSAPSNSVSPPSAGAGITTSVELVVIGHHARTVITHVYKIVAPNLCAAGDAFAELTQPGMSAPGAPAVQPGFVPRIVLTGNNPISQYANFATLSIVNTTLPGHRYYYGTVAIQVEPDAGGSVITILGVGTGQHALENAVVGYAFFGAVVNSITQYCNAAAGVGG